MKAYPTLTKRQRFLRAVDIVQNGGADAWIGSARRWGITWKMARNIVRRRRIEARKHVLTADDWSEIEAVLERVCAARTARVLTR